MIATHTIPVTKIEKSKLPSANLLNAPFGKYYTDYMLEADYVDGEWKKVEIRPYQPLLIGPANMALHYGQAIFEGIKAYKSASGEVKIFRPHDNFRRFNISAERLCMPDISEEIFIEGMRQLIDIERDWVPTMDDHSLYIRPFMFATDESLGVRASNTYKFIIILCPTGPYYSKPMRIYVEEKYTRAAPGGVGFSKNAGNYAGSLYPAKVAKDKGYDQVLWTDAFEHKWLQEVGTMNVFFVINDVAVTPGLEEGTILAGVTRDSVIVLLKEMGLKVEERAISIDELINVYKAGNLKEVFGTGTAATISPIKELKYKDTVMEFNLDEWKISPEVKKRLDGIRCGETEDKYNWLVTV